MSYLEDVAIGKPVPLGSHTFTAEEIVAFASQYDPQPFHLDDAAAAKTHFGRLCASGWHTAAIYMRLLVAHRKKVQAEAAAGGGPVARWGPSPGFREMKWLKPVYAGDTISYATEPVEARPSQSRPGWGLVFSNNTGVNQHGEPVFSFIGSAFVERRPAAAGDDGR